MKNLTLFLFLNLLYINSIAQISKKLDSLASGVRLNDVYYNQRIPTKKNNPSDTIKQKNIILIIDNKIQYYQNSTIDSLLAKGVFKAEKIESFNNETGIDKIYIIKTKEK